MRIPHEPVPMTSGLSRRFTFELFLPGPFEADLIKAANRNRKQSTFSNDIYQQEVELAVNNVANLLNQGFPTELDFSAVDSWCDTQDIPHFEEEIYRRLSVGWAVVQGYFPQIRMDKVLVSLFENEIKTRETLKSNAMGEVVMEVVRSNFRATHETFNSTEGSKPSMELSKLTRFMARYYQLPVPQIRSAISVAKGRGLRQETVDGDTIVYVK
jgi:hypothetical protein